MSTWRTYLQRRGFHSMVTLEEPPLWMVRRYPTSNKASRPFYIRRTRPEESGKFVTVSGSFGWGSAYHETIEDAYAAFAARLLTGM